MPSSDGHETIMTKPKKKEEKKQAPHWMDCNCVCHGFHDNTGLSCPHCHPEKYPNYKI